MKDTNAFTLIELLIVVGIIAILAAIAVPNFLEAQVRAKVSRAKNDMRAMATALEAYHVDNNAYPDASADFRPLRHVTTPVAFITSLPEDPFPPRNMPPMWARARSYRYGSMPIASAATRWALASDGPDLRNDTQDLTFYPGYSPGLFYGGDPEFPWVLYDPTNGTLSQGDLFRGSDYVPN
jgi:type II secretion system protein G